MRKSIAHAVRDENIANRLIQGNVAYEQEDSLFGGVHHSEIVCHLVSLRHAGSMKVGEATCCAGDINMYVVAVAGLCDEHVVLSHNDGVALLKTNIHGAEEII